MSTHLVTRGDGGSAHPSLCTKEEVFVWSRREKLTRRHDKTRWLRLARMMFDRCCRERRGCNRRGKKTGHRLEPSSPSLLQLIVDFHTRQGTDLLLLVPLKHILLHYILLRYILLHYILLHYVLLHYILLHYILLHYTLLHYILLHPINSRTCDICDRSNVRLLSTPTVLFAQQC